MVLDNYELERIAEDQYKNRRIGGSVYCGNCGYNLRTLPYIYTCPECGNRYNARPLTMKGVFAPHEIEFPFRDILAGLACLGGTGFLAAEASKSGSSTNLILAVGLGAITLWCVFYIRAKLQRYAKAIEIAHRVAEQEQDAG